MALHGSARAKARRCKDLGAVRQGVVMHGKEPGMALYGRARSGRDHGKDRDVYQGKDLGVAWQTVARRGT